MIPARSRSDAYGRNLAQQEIGEGARVFNEPACCRSSSLKLSRAPGVTDILAGHLDERACA